MTTWDAHAEFTADSPLVVDEELAERLNKHFASSVAFLGDRNRIGLHMPIEAASMFDALAELQRNVYAVVGVLSSYGIRAPRPVRVTLGTFSDSALETFGAGGIPLVGFTDIATMGGFSRQYARQLAARADFPPQVAVVSGSPAYFRPEVEDFLERIGRLRVERLGADWMFEGQRGEMRSGEAAGAIEHEAG
jgi:hypothetical protein